MVADTERLRKAAIKLSARCNWIILQDIIPFITAIAINFYP